MDAADLDGYLARIGASRPAAPSLAALAAVQWAHVRAIPFENLDIVLGRPVAIDLAAIVDKLVRRERGGYCFEHNTLAGAALRALGYGVTALAARVRWMAPGPAPRTHMLLAVDVPGAPRQLVDCGFGGQCPTGPIPLVAGAEVAWRHDRYRLIAADDGLLLQMAGADGWSDLYWFTLEPHHPVDFEVANHYTSTHPASRFTSAPMCARTTDDGRVALRGSELVRRRGDAIARRIVADGEELLAVLAADFGLRFPPGTRFRGGPG